MNRSSTVYDVGAAASVDCCGMDMAILDARRLRRWAPALAALALILAVSHGTERTRRVARLAANAAGATLTMAGDGAADAGALWTAAAGLRAKLPDIGRRDDVRDGATEAQIAQFEMLARIAGRLGFVGLAPSPMDEAATQGLAAGSSVTPTWAPEDVACAATFAQVEPVAGPVDVTLSPGPSVAPGFSAPLRPRFGRRRLRPGRSALLAVFGDRGAAVSQSRQDACSATGGPWASPPPQNRRQGSAT